MQPLIYRPLGQWADGDFTVAYMWDNTFQAANSMHDCIEYGIVNPLMTLAESGETGFLNPYPTSFNAYSWSGNLQGNPGWISTQAGIPPLTNNLANYYTKNFYFNGHGGESTIGNTVNANRTDLVIFSTEIAGVLGNNDRLHGWYPHPYRFVWLDACDTGDKHLWAHAFGIKDKITYDQLNRTGHAQAFIGSVNPSRGAETDDDWANLEISYLIFYTDWMNGQALDQCLTDASNPSLAFPLGLDWDFKEYLFSYFYQPVPWRYRIYGYAGLTRTMFLDGYDNSIYYK